MIETILLGAMIFCGVLLLITVVSDRFIFHYKKTPGRGYAQIAKPNMPKWLVSLYSSLLQVGFFGFCVFAGLLAWRLS